MQEDEEDEEVAIKIQDNLKAAVANQWPKPHEMPAYAGKPPSLPPSLPCARQRARPSASQLVSQLASWLALLPLQLRLRTGLIKRNSALKEQGLCSWGESLLAEPRATVAGGLSGAVGRAWGPCWDLCWGPAREAASALPSRIPR